MRLPVAKSNCLGLAFGPKYVEGVVEELVEGWLERIGEDDPDEEAFLQDLWEEGEVHQAYKLRRLQHSALVSVNAVAYALVCGEKGVEVVDLYRLQKSRAGLKKGHTLQMIHEGCSPG